MKYLLLVSHGGLSEGLKNTLAMFNGDSMDSVIAIGLQPGESVSSLSSRVEELISSLPSDSQFVILADIIGGSPLTTVCNVLNSHNQLHDSVVLGGMNLPMALSALLSKDALDRDALKEAVISEGNSAIKSFDDNSNETSEDDI